MQLAPVNDQNVGHGRHFAPVSLYSQRGGAAAVGGFTVNIIRLMGKWLSERLGQEFVIENRSGATMNIATDVAVRAPSDTVSIAH
jgi:hypothetical protein